MASLVSADGTSFELAEAETLLGRGGREYNDPPKVDVGPLEGGATVSHHHARIYRRTGQWYLRVESTARNPTLVGDKLIPGGEEAPLVDNIRIKLGEVVLTFHGPAEAVLQSPEMTMADGNGLTLAQSPLQPPAISLAASVVAPPPATVEPPAKEAPPVTAPKRSDNWPARLPGRPATLAALGVTEFKRVNPFRGLMIDEEAWADAHDYHRIQGRLHLLTAHGWGIIEGLEVLADPHVPNTLLIRPGVAFDYQGRPMLIGQERRLALSAADGATLYVVLRWREELTSPQRFWNDLDEYTRVVERCDALVQEAPPAQPVLELARLKVAGPVRNADDPLGPQPGEIDLRFRERLAVRPRPDLAVAQLVSADESVDGKPPRHILGLRYLLREIGQTTAYRARWAGTIRLGDPIPPVSLLYFSGSGKFTVDDAALESLRSFLQGGGVLMLDTCAEGNTGDFIGSAEALAKKLSSSLQPVNRSHPVLSARHVFAEPPLSGKKDETTLAESGGLVLSTVDYGCAWQGGPADKPLPREAVRAALELGVNVAVFARQRQRPLEVIELEA